MRIKGARRKPGGKVDRAAPRACSRHFDLDHRSAEQLGQDGAEGDIENFLEQAVDGAAAHLQQAGTACESRQPAKIPFTTQIKISLCARENGRLRQCSPRQPGGPSAMGDPMVWDLV